MPKRRIKKLEIEFSREKENYLIKSGICSKSIKNIVSDMMQHKTFWPEEYFHLRSKKEVDQNNFSIFDDSKIIIFEDKNIVPTLGIESKYFSQDSHFKNFIFHTPNEFSFLGNESIVSNPKPALYNRTIYTEDSSTQFDLFHETSLYFRNEDDLTQIQNFNDVELLFDIGSNDIDPNDPSDVDPRTGKKISDIFLSFNRMTNIPTEQVRFYLGDGTSILFPCYNGNTVYLYNKFASNAIQKDSSLQASVRNYSSFDFLGNIATSYLNLGADVRFGIEFPEETRSQKTTKFLESAFCFNSLTPYTEYLSSEHDMTSFNFTSTPIDNFGFPFDSKFKAEDRHMTSMKDYITKPFVLESIVFEGVISNWSTNLVSQPNQPCINTVNMFVLNQRGNLNSDSLEINYDQLKFYDEDLETQWIAGDRTINFNEEGNFTNGYFTHSANRISSYVTSYASGNTPTISGLVQGLDKKTYESMQRELVTNISIVNYANNSSADVLFDIDKIRQNADLFIDKSDDPLNHNFYTAQCIYEDMPVRIESKVKNYHSNNNLPMMSKYNIFTTRKNPNRTNTDKKSERSITNKIINTSTSTNLNSFNNTVSREINSYNSEYVLYPTDNLIFGFTLTPSLLDPTENRLSGNLGGNGDDIFKISSKGKDSFKILLKGYYLENKNKKVIIQKTNVNTSRVGFYESEVVDTQGIPDVYLHKGSYFDLEPTGEAGSSHQGDLYKYSSRITSGFNNLLSIPNFNNNQNTYDSDIYYENDSDESANNFRIIKKYFNLKRFGQYSDYLSYFRYYPYIDTSFYDISLPENRKQKNYLIEKKFMKGFFTQKSLESDFAIIKFNFSKMDAFGGENYLKENILSSFVNADTGTFVLHFSIRDNLNNEVNFAILPQDSLADDAAGLVNPGRIYQSTSIDFIYQGTALGVEPKKYILIYIKNEIVNSFNRVLNATNQQPGYSKDVQNKINEFINAIVVGINSVDSQVQYALFYENETEEVTHSPIDFKLKVSAEAIEKTVKDGILEIKIILNRKGSSNNAKIFETNFPQDVTFENFTKENIDIFNSYNTDTNSYYTSDDIFYLES